MTDSIDVDTYELYALLAPRELQTKLNAPLVSKIPL